MLLKNRQEIWKTAIPYFILAGIIFVFNIIPVWGFDGLIQDDQEYYFTLFSRHINDLRFSRNIFHAIYTLEIIKIACLTSIFTARLLIVLLFSIPSAFFIYYFSHYHYQLRKSASIAVAVMPFILPFEPLIPTYLVGSYMLPAILFSFITIFFILNFSKQEKFSTPYFFLAVLSYFITIESSELMASMLPVFLFLIFIFRKLSGKQFLLGAAFSLMAARKSILVILKPHGPVNSVTNDIPVSEVKDRIIHFMDFMNPLHSLTNIGVLNIIMLSIIIAGAIIVLVDDKRLKNILSPGNSPDIPVNKHFYFVYYYLFPLVWLIFSVIPFLFFSQYLASRYMSISAIALNFMFILSISVIYSLFSSRKIPLAIILFLIVAVSGFNRQQYFREYYKALNEQYRELGQTLKNYKLPDGAQIIVTSSNPQLSLGYGITRRSNGVLQYVLKTRKVKGQIMTEKLFYDPFQLLNKPWGNRYVDIDTTKSTFLFRCFNEDASQNKRLHYALRWADEQSKGSNWSIFYFDDQGSVSNLVKGSGYEAYSLAIDTLSARGIRPEDIMFGGIPARNDSVRLGL